MCDCKPIRITRVTGYLRPDHLYNPGKKMEHGDRTCYKVGTV